MLFPQRPSRSFLRAVRSRLVSEEKVEIPELGLSYIVPTRSLIGRLVSQNGMYEEHIVNWITARFAPSSGGTFVDVGANFGWYSCLFAKIAGDAGQVVLYEPDPDNSALLQRNLALNGIRNATLHRAGAGSTPSAGTLHKAHRSNPGAHSLISSDSSVGEVPVSIVTLNDTVPPGRISLLKMDIEGFELEAVRGGRDVLARTDHIVMEFSPEFLKRGGYCPNELWHAFDSFNAYRFEHGSKPIAIASAPQATCDLLFTRE